MGLVFESHDETLRLTGIPVGLVRPEGVEQGALIVDFMIVSTPGREIVCSEYKMKIPLPDLWYKKLAGRAFESDDRLVIDLVRANAENEVDRALFDLLGDSGNSLYWISDARIHARPDIVQV